MRDSKNNKYNLTDMEIKTIKLASKGLSTKESADAMFRGARTVEGYKMSIKKKTKSKTFTQACIRFLS